MNQQKIGSFLRELRKEKGLTQEQTAEQFGVARRTVSRWETGSNMPDLDILVEMTDYYDVDLRELLDGERKVERMNRELEETVLKVADYSNAEKTKMTKVLLVYLVLGLAALLANGVMDILEIGGTFWTGFAKGATFGLAMIAIVFAILYATGKLNKPPKSRRQEPQDREHIL